MTTTGKTAINITPTPDTVIRPEIHYVFLERRGSIPTNAPQVWQELRPLIPAIALHNQITGYLSLYKVGAGIYRAGVSVASRPDHLPENVACEKLPGGIYARFTLTGSYSDLPEATRRAFGIVADNKLPLRDDYNIENYVSDPRVTPEDRLITEIMFPVGAGASNVAE